VGAGNRFVATKQSCAAGGRVVAAACPFEERASLAAETARPLRTRARVAVASPDRAGFRLLGRAPARAGASRS
jgi:hypothetical protein